MRISNGVGKYIKNIIKILILLINIGFIFSLYLCAREANEQIEQIEYTASDTRDPFVCSLPEKPKEILVQEISSRPEAENRLPEMNIQGIVWQSDNPQAIIDGQVVKVGDTIKEAKVIKIAKEGVSFVYQEKLFTLNSPNVEILNSTKAKDAPEGAR